MPDRGQLGGGPQAFPGGPQGSLRVWAYFWGCGQLMEIVGHTCPFKPAVLSAVPPARHFCPEGPVSAQMPAGP